MKKQCNKCKKNKDISKFYKDSTKKDGLRTTCNVCKSYVDKLYREKNKLKLKISKTAYYQANKETINAYHKDWYENHGGREWAKKYDAKRTKKDPKRSRKYIDAWKKLQVKNITNYYVIDLLTRYDDIKKEDIPNEMIELKREQIKLIRAIRND
tara:strand:+ start:365 stop:826 length:462 start_codon:yes stop_codon:yes gene_type:complete